MRLLISLILIFTLAAGAFPQSSKLTSVVRTEHFLVHCEPGMRSTAETIANDSEYWIRDISRRLDARDRIEPPIPMYIYKNQGEFEKATGKHMPGMVLGRAYSMGYVELDASGIFAPAQQVAGHEIAHVLMFRILGPDAQALPLWANEGIAKFMTDDWSDTDRTVLSEAAIAGTLMPLDSISRAFPEGDQQALAYAEGASAIRYLVEKHGEKAIPRLVHETARTGSFDAAMRSVAGSSTSEFEKNWRKSIEGSFGIAKLLRIARFVGAIAFPLLIILAYLAFRRRRRKMIERYLQEEWEEANWRDWGGT
jgi:hypothetical protein